MGKLVRRLLGDQKGATAIEYGLIISLIVLAMMGGMSAFANSTINMWSNVTDSYLENG